MIEKAMYTTILTLHQRGTSQRQIAKMTNTDRKTVRRIITKYEKHNIQEPTIYQRISKVSAFHIQIISLLEHKLSAIRIYEEIKKIGFDGSY